MVMMRLWKVTGRQGIQRGVAWVAEGAGLIDLMCICRGTMGIRRWGGDGWMEWEDDGQTHIRGLEDRLLWSDGLKLERKGPGSISDGNEEQRSKFRNRPDIHWHFIIMQPCSHEGLQWLGGHSYTLVHWIGRASEVVSGGMAHVCNCV